MLTFRGLLFLLQFWGVLRSLRFPPCVDFFFASFLGHGLRSIFRSGDQNHDSVYRSHSMLKASPRRACLKSTCFAGARYLVS